jgi:hypothetical protein
MNTDRRAIFSLVASRHITPAEAERLIVACSHNDGAWWLLAGCVLFAGLAQLEPHLLTGVGHLLRTVMVGSIPALHHAMLQCAALLGGKQ